MRAPSVVCFTVPPRCCGMSSFEEPRRFCGGLARVNMMACREG
jgi:hypothetical protein